MREGIKVGEEINIIVTLITSHLLSVITLVGEEIKMIIFFLQTTIAYEASLLLNK